MPPIPTLKDKVAETKVWKTGLTHLISEAVASRWSLKPLQAVEPIWSLKPLQAVDLWSRGKHEDLHGWARSEKNDNEEFDSEEDAEGRDKTNDMKMRFSLSLDKGENASREIPLTWKMRFSLSLDKGENVWKEISRWREKCVFP